MKKKKRDKGKKSPSIGEFATKVLAEQASRMRAHEAGTRLGEDIEALHDMRVAVRRLRAAIRLFAPVLSKRWKSIRGELSWLAEALGEVRDLDVLIQHVEGWLPKLRQAADPTLTLLEAIRAERDAKRSQLIEALDSPRYQSLTQSLMQDEKRRKGEARRAVLIKLPGLIERRSRRFFRAAQRLGPDSRPEAKHEVRILAKRLRYAVEFSSDLYGKRADRLAKSLAELQDAFGAQQDAHVANAHMERLIGDNDRLQPALKAILSRYATVTSREAKRVAGILTERLPHDWDEYRQRMEKLCNSAG